MVEKLLKASSSSPRKHGKNVMCYRCGEKGHLAEICRKEATRFVCGAFGHRSFYCPRRGKQGNQVILFLVLQPYEDMVRNVEHLRKCAVSLRGRASLSKASFWRKSVPSIWIQFLIFRYNILVYWNSSSIDGVCLTICLSARRPLEESFCELYSSSPLDRVKLAIRVSYFGLVIRFVAI